MFCSLHFLFSCYFFYIYEYQKCVIRINFGEFARFFNFSYVFFTRELQDIELFFLSLKPLLF